jgi:hypothetical protein
MIWYVLELTSKMRTICFIAALDVCEELKSIYATQHGC